MGISFAYPSGFVVLSLGTGSGGGGIQAYRVVDTRYTGGYPPGQVELWISSMDADSLAAWISKHTGYSPGNRTFYWVTTSNVQATAVPGHAAISFDAPAESVTVHATAFLQGSSRVAVLDWYAADPTYTATIQPVAQQMLASFQG